MAYIEQFYNFVTGDTITAARLNGNITNIITGLSAGTKSVNVSDILLNSVTLINSNRDGTLRNLNCINTTNDGNPYIVLGATSSNKLGIEATYHSGAVTLDSIMLKTYSSSSAADAGKFIFSVDETDKLVLNDAGASITGTLLVSGASTLSGVLGVTGDFAVNTNKFTVAALTGNTLVAGTLNVTSDIAINTNKFTVTASSGNTTIAGTLGVTGVQTNSDFIKFADLKGICANTSDGSDSSTLLLCGGGSFDNTRGAAISIVGNEALTAKGKIQLAPGRGDAGSNVGIVETYNATGSIVAGFGLATDGASLASRFYGALTISGAAILSSSLAVTGDVAINTNKFTVTAASGNTLIAGTLGVTGAITGTLATAAQTNITSVGTLTGLTVSGGINVGSATGAVAGQVKISGEFASLDGLYLKQAYTDTYDTIRLRTNVVGAGLHGLAIGAGVGNALDTNLYRDAANSLKTDDSLTVALGLNVGSGTGAGTGQIVAASSTPFLKLAASGAGDGAGSVQFFNSTTQKWNLGTYATTNDLFIYNNGGTSSYNLYIKHANGNVGIGTTSPLANLQVGASQSATGTQVFRIGVPSITAGTVYDALHIDTYSGTAFDKGASISFGLKDVSVGEYTSRIVHFANESSVYGSKLQLQTHSNTQNVWNTGILIDNVGNVGIGTSSPAATLDVNGSIKVATDIYTVARTDYFATSTKNGWSGTPTGYIYYKQIGKVVWVQFSITGTSNNNYVEFELPSSIAPSAVNTIYGCAYVVNNSVISTTGGLISNPTISRYISISPNMSGNSSSWTSSGTKTVAGQFFYTTD